MKVVSRGNYVAVVCEREENAIRAARQLKVEWTHARDGAVPGVGRISSPTCERRRLRRARQADCQSAIPDAAFAGAATVIEAEYDVPFQGHTAFGPAHALADPSNDQLTIYSNDMKSYGMRNGVAQFLKIPRESVRVVWMQGPQAYGRTAADDAGFEAAFLANELGRPVRMQWSAAGRNRVGHEGSGLCRHDARRRSTRKATRRARLRRARRRLQSCRLQRARHRADRAADGQRKAQPARGRASFPSDMYAIPNRRMASSVVPMPLAWETPVRMGNLRDPDGPQVTFASEGSSTSSPPRRRPIRSRSDWSCSRASTDDDCGFKRARSIACIKAAAEKFGWEPRPSPKPRGTGDIADRPRRRLRVSQRDRRRRDRRSRSQSANRPRLGQAHRLRARLRPGDQSGSADARRSKAACCIR